MVRRAPRVGARSGDAGDARRRDRGAAPRGRRRHRPARRLRFRDFRRHGAVQERVRRRRGRRPRQGRPREADADLRPRDAALARGLPVGQRSGRAGVQGRGRPRTLRRALRAAAGPGCLRPGDVPQPDGDPGGQAARAAGEGDRAPGARRRRPGCDRRARGRGEPGGAVDRRRRRGAGDRHRVPGAARLARGPLRPDRDPDDRRPDLRLVGDLRLASSGAAEVALVVPVPERGVGPDLGPAEARPERVRAARGNRVDPRGDRRPGVRYPRRRVRRLRRARRRRGPRGGALFGDLHPPRRGPRAHGADAGAPLRPAATPAAARHRPLSSGDHVRPPGGRRRRPDDGLAGGAADPDRALGGLRDPVPGALRRADRGRQLACARGGRGGGARRTRDRDRRARDGRRLLRPLALADSDGPRVRHPARGRGRDRLLARGHGGPRRLVLGAQARQGQPITNVPLASSASPPGADGSGGGTGWRPACALTDCGGPRPQRRPDPLDRPAHARRLGRFAGHRPRDCRRDGGWRLDAEHADGGDLGHPRARPGEPARASGRRRAAGGDRRLRRGRRHRHVGPPHRPGGARVDGGVQAARARARRVHRGVDRSAGTRRPGSVRRSRCPTCSRPRAARRMPSTRSGSSICCLLTSPRR